MTVKLVRRARLDAADARRSVTMPQWPNILSLPRVDIGLEGWAYGLREELGGRVMFRVHIRRVERQASSHCLIKVTHSELAAAQLLREPLLQLLLEHVEVYLARPDQALCLLKSVHGTP